MIKEEFSEVQRVDSIWPLSILTLTLVFNWVLYFISGYKSLDFFYGSMLSIALLCTFFTIVRLHTKINSVGIQYKFFPFHFKWQSISWNEIETSEIRTYKPIREYGGWGLRYGKQGKAYTIKGKTGLQLYLKTGRNILIGTNKYKDLIQVLRYLKK
ncbi:MAG: hypothetical protein KA270_14875 [Saprospiraceae bacterium]|nr:hypothetical protein [Saprospiraceae bacterium]MBP6568451.1 hypothetical protein [Saprospiraceae bacterium]